MNKHPRCSRCFWVCVWTGISCRPDSLVFRPDLVHWARTLPGTLLCTLYANNVRAHAPGRRLQDAQGVFGPLCSIIPGAAGA